MPTLNLSPTARTVLTILGVILATVIPVLATAGVPVIVTAVMGAIVAAFGYLGLVPPQVGGTQQGVMSPAVVEPPEADVVDAPVKADKAAVVRDVMATPESPARTAARHGSVKGSPPEDAQPDSSFRDPGLPGP